MFFRRAHSGGVVFSSATLKALVYLTGQLMTAPLLIRRARYTPALVASSTAAAAASRRRPGDGGAATRARARRTESDSDTQREQLLGSGAVSGSSVQRRALPLAGTDARNEQANTSKKLTLIV